MRYLDRQPRVGDLVHVEYEGEYRNTTYPNEHGIWAGVGAASVYVAPANAIVRVVAPEPKVGDVVTADMDLPEGSIIEAGEHGSTAKRALADGQWYSGGNLLANAPGAVSFVTWRIVRIGGGQP